MIELTLTQITRSPSKLWAALNSGDVRIIRKEQKPNGMVIDSAIVKREEIDLGFFSKPRTPMPQIKNNDSHT